MTATSPSPPPSQVPPPVAISDAEFTPNNSKIEPLYSTSSYVRLLSLILLFSFTGCTSNRQSRCIYDFTQHPSTLPITTPSSTSSHSSSSTPPNALPPLFFPYPSLVPITGSAFFSQQL